MITVIREKPEPRKRVTCSNCGSELEYGNADLYKEEGPLPTGYTYIHSFYFYCPVCRCKEYADWIIQDTKVETNVESTHSQNFDRIDRFKDGFARVKLNDKYNHINKDEKLLSSQWFDWCDDFQDEFARITLNNKWNYINTEGKLLSDAWFDCVWSFNEGFAMVRLKEKYYYLNTKGQLCDYDTKEVLNNLKYE